MTINELKSLLSRFGIRPSKKLGQNFLLSEAVLDQIVQAADLNANDIVLEIGPGLGALTGRLAERAGRVIAVEKDKKLAHALRKLFKSKKNVEIIEGDALFINSVIPDLIRDPGLDSRRSLPRTAIRGGNDNKEGYKLVANIPYNITGELLRKFLTPLPHPPHQGEGNKNEFLPLDGGGKEGVVIRPRLMVLLLQKEVAERIVSEKGSLLSLSVKLYAEPEIIDTVGKENFYPVPEVDSAIVRLKVFSKPRLDVDERKFFQLLKVGFSSKRKMLKNNLAAVYGRQTDFDPIFGPIGINLNTRAEELSLGDWQKLYMELMI